MDCEKLLSTPLFNQSIRIRGSVLFTLALSFAPFSSPGGRIACSTAESLRTRLDWLEILESLVLVVTSGILPAVAFIDPAAPLDSGKLEVFVASIWSSGIDGLVEVLVTLSLRSYYSIGLGHLLVRLLGSTTQIRSKHYLQIFGADASSRKKKITGF